MKKLLTLLIVLIAVAGQAQNNFFYLEDVRWEISGIQYDEHWPGYIYTWHIGDMISKRDTIINNKEYKIVGWENTNKDYALRTDSVSKVWVIYLDRLIGYGTENDSIYIESDDSWIYRLSNDSTEYILYDYDVALGDNIDIYVPPFADSGIFPETGGMFSFLIMSFGSSVICVNNEQREAMHFEIEDPYAFFHHVGGIGAIRGGLIYTESTTYWYSHDVVISRVFQYGVQIYPCPVNIESNSIMAYPKVYPNPANTFINIDLPENIDKDVLRIYTIIGSLVKSVELKQSSSIIDISDLPSGLYLLNLQHRNYSVKIIVE